MSLKVATSPTLSLCLMTGRPELSRCSQDGGVKRILTIQEIPDLVHVDFEVGHLKAEKRTID